MKEKYQADSAGRPSTCLGVDTATQLYRALHQRHVAVLSLDQFFVRLNPTRYTRDERWSVPINKFVRYKGFASKISAASYKRAINDFESWMQMVECEGDRDARVLPMHLFLGSNQGDWNLDDGRSRKGFEAKYGAPNKRACEQGFLWTPDNEKHGGRDPQFVRGKELSLGLHWDLTEPRYSGKRLVTPDGVWEAGQSAHLNVYPNGYVRNGHNFRRLVPVKLTTTNTAKKNRRRK